MLAENGRFYYSDNFGTGGQFQFIASIEHPYTATCEKKVRVRRR